MTMAAARRRSSARRDARAFVDPAATTRAALRFEHPPSVGSTADVTAAPLCANARSRSRRRTGTNVAPSSDGRRPPVRQCRGIRRRSGLWASLRMHPTALVRPGRLKAYAEQSVARPDDRQDETHAYGRTVAREPQGALRRVSSRACAVWIPLPAIRHSAVSVFRSFSIRRLQGQYTADRVFTPPGKASSVCP
jgi:hypothetical protein